MGVSANPWQGLYSIALAIIKGGLANQAHNVIILYIAKFLSLKYFHQQSFPTKIKHMKYFV